MLDLNQSCRIAWQTWLLTAILSVGAFAQEQEPPRSGEDFIRSLPVEEQSRRLTKMAEEFGILVGFLTPEGFSLLRSDKAFQRYMDVLTEPLDHEWLDALEDLIQEDEYDSARFRAAVLLFRHGQVSGREYLFQLLQQDQDLRAALVFAVAQERGTEAAIVDAVVAAVVHRRDRHRLDDALVRWDSDVLKQALSRPEVRETFKARSALPSYARLAVEAADAESSLKLREAAFDTPHYRISTRLTMAAGAIRRDPDDDVARALFLQELNERPIWWVFRAIAETGDSTFIDDLLHFLDHSVLGPENETCDERNARHRNAEHAIEAIVHLGGELPVAHTLAIHASTTHAVRLRRIELLMLRSGNELLIDAVRERLGDEEVDRILALQQLKPIPDELPRYAPRSSRGWIWY